MARFSSQSQTFAIKVPKSCYSQVSNDAVDVCARCQGQRAIQLTVMQISYLVMNYFPNTTECFDEGPDTAAFSRGLAESEMLWNVPLWDRLSCLSCVIFADLSDTSWIPQDVSNGTRYQGVVNRTKPHSSGAIQCVCRHLCVNMSLLAS